MSSEELPDNPLFRWYERYIGEPQTETDVYAGFGLFFISIVGMIIGAALFIASITVTGARGGDTYFLLARAAYSLFMLGVPLLMLGIVVLLPVERKATYGAVVGVVITVAAAVWFNLQYPAWFDKEPGGIDTTMSILGTYASGLGIVIATTGVALVAHQLERVKAPAPSEIEIEEEPDPGESYTEEEIRADIDEAMEGVEMTWGGVEKSENKRLSFSGGFEADVDQSGFDVEPDKRVETGGVDQQVTGLRQMKGGETKTATSNSTVDDQTAALQELKEQKAEDEVPDNAPTTDEGIVTKLLSRIRMN